MGDVKVGYGESAAETAQSLLDAAEELDLSAGVVKTSTDDGGGFVVPEEVADKAGVDFEVDSDDDGEEVPVEDLKGQALEDALDEAGLSKSGNKAEKQARLAEYRDSTVNGDPADDDKTEE